jgi:hypothetical protein
LGRGEGMLDGGRGEGQGGDFGQGWGEGCWDRGGGEEIFWTRDKDVGQGGGHWTGERARSSRKEKAPRTDFLLGGIEAASYGATYVWIWWKEWSKRRFREQKEVVFSPNPAPGTRPTTTPRAPTAPTHPKPTRTHHICRNARKGQYPATPGLEL